ncbi:hypothetical protein Tco_0047864, partial [Tanacetum coccineum]
MSNLKFVETHNLVVFLEKPEESDGFEGIIDFLNASSIRYALTVNSTIYTPCIKQFWATTKAKTVNGEVQIQALVDGKKVIVTKTSVRRALQLKDAEALVDGKKVIITMASAIICLATNQKFNFSKYIYDNMVKNLEGGVKFLIEGNGFSGRVTHLFETMMVQAPEELDTEVPQPSGSREPITDEAANEEHVPIHSNDPLLSGEDRLKLNELMELYTNFTQRVLDLENTKTSQAAEIAKLKETVKKLERRSKSRTLRLKRLNKVGRTTRIKSFEDEGLGAQEDASKQRR